MKKTSHLAFEDRRYPLTGLPRTPGPVFGPLESRVAYTFAGKSALALVLDYYRSCQVLKDKSSQVLVPHWLGSWVYMTMHPYCFPTTVMHKDVKGIVVYHQWGFPQKMEEIMAFSKKHKLFVLEDCAHSFDSSYQGKRLGTFGDESIWSFSKFFASVVGGAVYSRDRALLTFIKTAHTRHDTALGQKVFDHLVRTNKNSTESNLREIARNYAIYPELSVCPPYAKRVVAHELAGGALEKRRENFQILRSAFWEKREASLLEDSEVSPWVVPLFWGSKNARVAAVLQKAGIESGVYHFDVNRNMLDPRFVPCVAVPCHQGLSRAVIESMIDRIKTAL